MPMSRLRYAVLALPLVLCGCQWLADATPPVTVGERVYVKAWDELYALDANADEARQVGTMKGVGGLAHVDGNLLGVDGLRRRLRVFNTVTADTRSYRLQKSALLSGSSIWETAWGPSALVVGTDKGLVAFDYAHRRIIWSVADTEVRSSIVLQDGLAYCVAGRSNSAEAELLAVRVSDGEIIKRRPLETWTYSSQLAVTHDRLIVSAGNHLEALSTPGLQAAWSNQPFTDGEMMTISPLDSAVAAFTEPGLFEDPDASNREEVAAFDSATGRELWRMALGMHDYMDYPYAMSVGELTVAGHYMVKLHDVQAESESRQIMGISPDGEVKWRATLPYPAVAPPAAMDGTVFVKCVDVGDRTTNYMVPVEALSGTVEPAVRLTGSDR